MTATEWRVAVGDEATPVVYEPATSDAERAVFVCAHGAGGNMSDRSMLAAANVLRARGFGLVRFNFLYKERGSGRPDPMPKLMDTIAAVVARVRAELSPRRLVIGGRSMGGRVASMLAADGFACDALLLFAYPLHPAGQPAKLRDAHLRDIRLPVLCLNGTQDPLCRTDLMQRVVAHLNASWRMHWLEGADHSFHVRKSSGRSDAEVLDEVAHEVRGWVATL